MKTINHIAAGTAFLAVISVFAAAALSCGETGASSVSNVIPSETAAGSIDKNDAPDAGPAVAADVPDADYGGFSFVILTEGNDGGTTQYWLNSDADAQNGDSINDALYKRNLVVEERFNVCISQFETSEAASKLKKTVQSGDDEYQLFVHTLSSAHTLATGGYLKNLYEVPYISLTSQWWDQNLPSELTVSGKLYFDTGDICMQDDMCTFCAHFNKSLWQNYGLENPYDLVYSGAWTLDKMQSLGQNVTTDLNGDGVYNEDDLWGILSEAGFAINFYFSAGERQVVNHNGEFSIEFGSERSVSVAKRAIDFLQNSADVFLADKIKGDTWTVYKNMFIENRALLRTSRFLNIPRDLRVMDVDFGLLPLPKYDEAQQEYYNAMRSDGYVAALPATLGDTDRACVITESIAAESYNILRPAFYDVCLRGKVLRDNESEGMLDIIFGNKVYDLGWLFSLGGMTDAIQNQVTKSNADVAGAMAKVLEKAQTQLDKLIASYDNL